MRSRPVLLFGFEDQPNLGLGYLASVLEQDGFSVEFVDCRLDTSRVFQLVADRDPLIIGLSIIYQYFTPRFANLVRLLREEGTQAFICAGGHYPSLRPRDVLDVMPGLDCVVRFEGEETLLEIARRLREGEAWHDVRSIAYRTETETVETPLRPLIDDLDRLPFPRRPRSPDEILGVPFSTILASRGCPRDCTFCSIRQFYAAPPGRIRRVRSPENVVEEMLGLFHDQGVRVFLFQDDDFSLLAPADRQWALQFAESLKVHGLGQSVLWKMSCRSDEVEPEILSKLRDVGLFLVYLGIESGNETGLRALNKHITVAQNRDAIRTLRALDLRYEFGFMLFDPASTFDLVLENAQFLQEICGDGSAVAPFCKTLPYAGTTLEEDLQRQGRLKGDPIHPDYSFGDPRIDAWFAYLSDVLYPWAAEPGCLQAQLRWSLVEVDLLERLLPTPDGTAQHKEKIWSLAAWHNEIFRRVVVESAEEFRAGRKQSAMALTSIRQSAEEQRRWMVERLAAQREAFLSGIAGSHSP